jgi:hypothetical protein
MIKSRKNSKTEKLSTQNSNSEKLSRKNSKTEKLSRGNSSSDKLSRKKSKTEKLSRRNSNSDKLSRKKSKTEKLSIKNNNNTFFDVPPNIKTYNEEGFSKRWDETRPLYEPYFIDTKYTAKKVDLENGVEPDKTNDYGYLKLPEITKVDLEKIEKFKKDFIENNIENNIENKVYMGGYQNDIINHSFPYPFLNPSDPNLQNDMGYIKSLYPAMIDNIERWVLTHPQYRAIIVFNLTDFNNYNNGLEITKLDGTRMYIYIQVLVFLANNLTVSNQISKRRVNNTNNFIDKVSTFGNPDHRSIGIDVDYANHFVDSSLHIGDIVIPGNVTNFTSNDLRLGGFTLFDNTITNNDRIKYYFRNLTLYDFVGMNVRVPTNEPRFFYRQCRNLSNQTYGENADDITGIDINPIDVRNFRCYTYHWDSPINQRLRDVNGTIQPWTMTACLGQNHLRNGLNGTNSGCKKSNRTGRKDVLREIDQKISFYTYLFNVKARLTIQIGAAYAGRFHTHVYRGMTQNYQGVNFNNPVIIPSFLHTSHNINTAYTFSGGANYGVIYQFTLTPLIPYISYDNMPFDSEFNNNEEEIVFHKNCSIIQIGQPTMYYPPNGGTAKQIIPVRLAYINNADVRYCHDSLTTPVLKCDYIGNSHTQINNYLATHIGTLSALPDFSNRQNTVRIL